MFTRVFYGLLSSSLVQVGRNDLTSTRLCTTDEVWNEKNEMKEMQKYADLNIETQCAQTDWLTFIPSFHLVLHLFLLQHTTCDDSGTWDSKVELDNQRLTEVASNVNDDDDDECFEYVAATQ